MVQAEWGVPFLTVTKVFSRVQSYLERHWRRALRVREQLRFSEEAFHLLLAGGVGVMGGLVNLVFYYSTEWVKYLFLRSAKDPVEVAEMMEKGWLRVLTPTLGGLAAGLVLYWGLRLAGPQRSSNLLEVVVAGDGRLPFRSAVVKFVSSLFSIGSGASIGREGGITQLAATLASKWGQLAKWHPYRLRLLVGCGAASGIAAAYNAPISGAVFAALIVLGNFSMNLFAPLVFSSVVATMVSRSFFGIKPWYTVTADTQFTSVLQLPWFLCLGVITGGMGALFLKLLNKSERGFQQLRAPIYVRLALGGLVVGVLALRYPQVWGNGYVVANRIVQGDYPPAWAGLLFLGGVFLAKLVATLATVGSGAVGGVFTPTLFLGASLGAWFGLGLHELLGTDQPIAVFAVVGMGSMLAATTRSPLLAIIMIFEISLDYALMPPLMLACVVSILVARKLHPESIYTEPLRQKGLTVSQDATASEAATERTVSDLMRAPVPPVRETATLGDIVHRFLGSANNFLPVVNARQQLVGVVALQDLKEFLGGDEPPPGIIAFDVMRPPPPCVTPNQLLLEIFPLVLASELRNIPVVTTLQENRLVGALARAEVLGIFSEVIAATKKSGA
jgi:CIC family chloride channel protein